jgi:hypothetical protein
VTAVDGHTLAAVAAFGLAGTAHSLPGESLDAVAWQELRTGVSAKRLNGLLLSAIDSGELPASEAQHDQALEDQSRAMSGALLLEDLLLRVTGLFTVAGIASRALKGSAVAHLDYPSPDLRAYGDIDVLVRSDDFDRAAAALREAGMRRVFQPPRPGWDRRFGKGAMFRCADGLEVDLHRTFCTPPLGLRIDLGDVWADSEPLWIAGQVVEALPHEVRLLNAAYSGAVSDTDPRLSTLRDIAQLALHPRLDTRLVRELATRWRGQAVLAFAVHAAWRTLLIGDVTALSSWAERYRPSADEARELALYQQHRASETARALATARMLPSLSARASYLWALAHPDAEFTRATPRGALRRLTHGLADLRRTRRSA